MVVEKEEDDNQEKKDDESREENDSLPLEWRISKDISIDKIIGDITKGVRTHSKIGNFCYHHAYVSQVEPKNANDVLLDENWLMAMQAELNQFESNDVWDLVPCP